MHLPCYASRKDSLFPADKRRVETRDEMEAYANRPGKSWSRFTYANGWPPMQDQQEVIAVAAQGMVADGNLLRSK